MWFIRLIEFFDDLFDKVIEYFFCKHDWEFKGKIREQSLRVGYGHDSHISECTKCGKYMTEVLP